MLLDQVEESTEIVVGVAGHGAKQVVEEGAGRHVRVELGLDAVCDAIAQLDGAPPQLPDGNLGGWRVGVGHCGGRCKG